MGGSLVSSSAPTCAAPRRYVVSTSGSVRGLHSCGPTATAPATAIFWRAPTRESGSEDGAGAPDRERALPVELHVVARVREVVVQGVAGTLGRRRVPVTEDVCRGIVERVVAVDLEFPADDVLEGAERAARRENRAERAEHRHSGRPVVRTDRVRADYWLVDASQATFVRHAVVVDDEVVRDVAVAQRLHVVRPDAAHHADAVTGPVRVAVDCVMHDRGAHVRRVLGAARTRVP